MRRVLTIFFTCAILFSTLAMLGCEAFNRKFIRKREVPPNQARDNLVIPQEYNKEGENQEALYQQYYLFWKGYHGELIESLSAKGANRKKQFDCFKEVIKNLSEMQSLVKPPKQEVLGSYIKLVESLKTDVIKDIYENALDDSLKRAQQIKRKIEGDFSFNKIKDELK